MTAAVYTAPLNRATHKSQNRRGPRGSSAPTKLRIDDDSAGWFRLPNDLVDNGALAEIKTLGELKVYIVLKRHQNAESGEAWPSITTIADRAGMNRGAVSRAIRSLIDRGAIERVEEGRARNYTTHYRFLGGVSGATVSPSTVAPEQLHSVSSATVLAAQAQRGSVSGAAHIKTNTKTTNSDHTQPPGLWPAGCAGVVGGINLREELKACGITGANLEKFAKAKWLTALTIRTFRCHAWRQKDIENPAGWIISKLSSGGDPEILNIPLEALCKMANAGHIARLKDHDITEYTTFNSRGVYLFREGKEIGCVRGPGAMGDIPRDWIVLTAPNDVQPFPKPLGGN